MLTIKIHRANSQFSKLKPMLLNIIRLMSLINTLSIIINTRHVFKTRLKNVFITHQALHKNASTCISLGSVAQCRSF